MTIQVVITGMITVSVTMIMVTMKMTIKATIIFKHLMRLLGLAVPSTGIKKEER